MNPQSANAGVALFVRRFRRAPTGVVLPASVSGANVHRYDDVSRDAKGKSGEIAWGVALFVLAAVVLLWLHVQFGVLIASVE